MISILAGAGMMGLLIASIPVAFVLITVSIFLLDDKGISLLMVSEAMISGTDNFILISVPLFILMSNILLRCGVGRDLFYAAQSWVGHFPGGVAVATLLSCGLFAAISGSSVATSATIGVVAIPELVERGYDKKFILGLLAAGGTLGILIPPSIPMIVYAAVTEQSILEMFMAGIGPGLLLVGGFSTYSILRSLWTGEGRNAERASWMERVRATMAAGPTFLLAGVIIGGIYGGAFTPTEAAGVGVIIAVLITVFYTRTFSFEKLNLAIDDTLKTSVAILLIVAAAKLFGKTMAVYQVPQTLSLLITSNISQDWIFVSAICLVLLVLGLFLEGISMVVLMMPVLLPTLTIIGLDPLWFGIIFIIMVEVALVTPPVGLNLFVIQNISQDDISLVFKGVMPFIIILFLTVIWVYLFPGLALFLPFL